MSHKFYFHSYWRNWFSKPFDGGRLELLSFQFDWYKGEPVVWEITVFNFVLGGSTGRTLWGKR